LDSLRRVDEAITTSLDLKQVLRTLVIITAEVMGAKACAIFLADRHGRLTIAESYNLSREIAEKLVIEPGEKWTGVIVKERRPIARHDIGKESLKLGDLAAREGLRALIAAPLIIGHETLGAIDVWMDKTHHAKKTEINLLSYIASHAAAVIANAKLFGKEYQIAETLQNTLIGAVPESLGRLVFGHKYMPALDEAKVGGDLFDVVTLPNGKVALIVADVSGKGIQAAVHTGMIRYMLRAFIFEWPDSPAVALDHLNAALSAYVGPKTVVTVFCAIVDPDTGNVAYANAGHPPAIVLTRAGKQQTLLYRTGLPVGYSDNSKYEQREITLLPDDMLILYTDGIIEARRDRRILTIEGLQSIVFENAHLNAHEMVDAICEETSRFAHRDLRDDIAIMAASFGPRVEEQPAESDPLEDIAP
jgi:serine phosphatase RsbU (regulator of sigma subunit)